MSSATAMRNARPARSTVLISVCNLIFAVHRRLALVRTSFVASEAMMSSYAGRGTAIRSKVLPLPCFVSCSTSDRRRSERSMAPPGTSIDCNALMNALVRRLTSSSFAAPTIGGKAACTSLKSSSATSGVVIAAVVSSRRWKRREGAQWRARGPGSGERGRGCVDS